VYKEKLRTRFPKLKPAFRYAIAAVCGDLTGSICLCPSEVIKSNVQAGIFKTSTQAVTNIFKTKGLGGFYQGFLGLAARDIPFRVCQLTSYELIKNVYLKSNLKKEQQSEPQMESNLTPIESAAIGAIAGTFSAAITTPLDRIKTLLAINGNMSFTSCASMIFLEEGPLGFTRGLWPRICYVAPSVTIFFIVYEATHQHLKIANTIQSS
jgi:solute carrier family 25 S-adenosylmethionine transporter 26